MQPFNALIVSVAFILVCLIIVAVSALIKQRRQHRAYHTSGNKKYAKKSVYWQITNGLITEAKLDYKDTKLIFRKSRRVYRAHFKYQYYAYGRLYTQATYTLRWTPIKDLAALYVKHYPQGSPAVIRFHPEQPDKSVIDLQAVN